MSQTPAPDAEHPGFWLQGPGPAASPGHVGSKLHVFWAHVALQEQASEQSTWSQEVEPVHSMLQGPSLHAT